MRTSKTNQPSPRRFAGLTAIIFTALLVPPALSQTAPPTAPPVAEIRTPKPALTPRIHGPRVYGERPGRPFLYTIPATGNDPITFKADGLPPGLWLDGKTGRITGSVANAGEFNVILTASNALGNNSVPLLIKIGDTIALTPPLGWNSWNAFSGKVDQGKVQASADIMISSGLAKHGWTYINIDDTWQGKRTGVDHALQANDKFPDIAGLCDHIHSLGLKAGIYSTPWITSYAGFAGGSSNDPSGVWPPPRPRPATVAAATTRPTTRGARGPRPVNREHQIGSTHFMQADAKQWATWGFDYLKYDWNPNLVPDINEMSDALKASGRDIVYSLSNAAPFNTAADYSKTANAWRTTGDIRDTWQSMTANGFSQLRWQPYASPGHFNDPDMLVVGVVGWGTLHPTHLTPDELYTHITLWCLLASPMLLGNDMTQLDDFTLNLLTNDEVLAVDQDALGTEAGRISQADNKEVWAKKLSDGSWAVGLFNRGADAAEVTVNMADLKLDGPQPVRDLWRQKALPDAQGSLTLKVASHGAEMVKIGVPSK